MNEKIEVEEAVRNNSFLRNNKTHFVFLFFFAFLIFLSQRYFDFSLSLPFLFSCASKGGGAEASSLLVRARSKPN